MARRELEGIREAVKNAPPLSPAGRERQIVSLAYGNLKLEHDSASRVGVIKASDKIGPKKP